MTTQNSPSAREEAVALVATAAAMSRLTEPDELPDGATIKDAVAAYNAHTEVLHRVEPLDLARELLNADRDRLAAEARWREEREARLAADASRQRVLAREAESALAAREAGWQQGWSEALAADPDGDLAYIAERLRETYNEEGVYIVLRNLVRAREGRLS